MFVRPDGGAVAASGIVLDAVRCWRKARNAGHKVQPCLTAVLRDHGCEMLAPCFDSLMLLSEAALGRPIRVGEAHMVSRDEHLLLDCLASAQWARAGKACSDGIASALDCALRSIRIMMGLAVPASLGRGKTI
jgi:hypothetical protein